MRSITIHGLDDELDRLIRERAAAQNQSLNKTIKSLISDSLGLSTTKKRKSDFSKFCGVWNREEFNRFEEAIKDFERVDFNDWQ